jgi:hypothetical protein
MTNERRSNEAPLLDTENVFHDENMGGWVAQYREAGEWYLLGSYMTKHDTTMALVNVRNQKG